MTEISKILIANRGEIACRVIRTAKSMGIKTVAVYSDADANALHTKLADEAVHIGASPVGDSYLVIDKIIQAAKSTKSDAIHPGYGFLSENAAFSDACAKNKLIFIGPPTHAIEVMGDKARSKRAMLEAGVPCVPGYQNEDQADQTLITAAKEIGLPVMIKAAAGGGGRGMRLVHKVKDLKNAIQLARSEAENAFGSGVLIVEKAVQEPRHVEIQVFADEHGNTIHLGERDCSVQRRHQKVIEEAPCPVMTEELRAKMGTAAVAAARAVDYRGAGTVEFLLDNEGQFYFLEMNTRLQVEHPVTEEVTGLDLVAMQISVALGKPLPVEQHEVSLTGHAIEVRLYTEDPQNDFLPSTGKVQLWHRPIGEGIRVDDGIESGSVISPFYDAMVAKIIAKGETREEAIRRLTSALEQTALFGISSNRDFLINALSQPAFKAGEATTAFIKNTYGEKGYSAEAASLSTIASAIILDMKDRETQALQQSITVNNDLLNWSSTHALTFSADYKCGDDEISIRSEQCINGVSIDIDDANVIANIISNEAPRATLNLNGSDVSAIYFTHEDELHIATPSETRVITNLSASLRSADLEAGGGTILSPMHGKLMELSVVVGEQVIKGQKLAVLEAMKMQHEINAEIDGRIQTIAASIGDQVAANALILEIAPAEED